MRRELLRRACVTRQWRPSCFAEAACYKRRTAISRTRRRACVFFRASASMTYQSARERSLALVERLDSDYTRELLHRGSRLLECRLFLRHQLDLHDLFDTAGAELHGY